MSTTSSFQSPTTTQTHAPSGPSPIERTTFASATATGLTICLTLMIGMMFLLSLSWTWRQSKDQPRLLNKAGSVWIWRWAPVVYTFVVLTSLSEVALASWLELQWNFNRNRPNSKAQVSTSLLLWASCWTFITAAAYAVVFLHPAWHKHPVSSIGGQAIWILVTLCFWIAGAATLNAAVSGLASGAACSAVVYCSQIRGLYALSILMSLVLSGGFAVLVFLAWQTIRTMLVTSAFELKRVSRVLVGR